MRKNIYVQCNCNMVCALRDRLDACLPVNHYYLCAKLSCLLNKPWHFRRWNMGDLNTREYPYIVIILKVFHFRYAREDMLNIGIIRMICYSYRGISHHHCAPHKLAGYEFPIAERGMSMQVYHFGPRYLMIFAAICFEVMDFGAFLS